MDGCSNLDVVVNRAFEGPKKPKQPAKKIERPVDDIESRYEERAERNAAKDDDNEENNMAVEYLDALPVKSLTGELRYLTKPKKPGRDCTLLNCISGVF